MLIFTGKKSFSVLLMNIISYHLHGFLRRWCLHFPVGDFRLLHFRWVLKGWHFVNFTFWLFYSHKCYLCQLNVSAKKDIFVEVITLLNWKATIKGSHEWNLTFIIKAVLRFFRKVFLSIIIFAYFYWNRENNWFIF